MTTALTTQQKAISLRDELFKHQKQFESAMPKWMAPERLIRVVFTTAMKNPKILDCSRESILGAIMQCAQLGLEPILGRAYLIPYSNNKNISGKWVKVMECQFQPGYQGLIDLARRTGTISDVMGYNVY
jgi:recombination protein RecT